MRRAAALLALLAAWPAWHAFRIRRSDAFAARAAAAMRAADHEAAAERMGSAVDWDPANTRKRVLLANTLVLTGRAEEALFELRQAMSEPRDPEPPFTMGLAYASLGRAQEAERMFAESERRRLAGLRAAPGDARLMHSLGEFYLTTGRGREALDCFIKAALLAPDDPRPAAAIERIRLVGLAPRGAR